MRDELMSEIIKLEWDMFSHVSNVGGPASCQLRPDTIKIMRKSQAATWSDELLASYLEDLKTATREGRNIMTEKYARMMESTFPEEYRKLAASLPPVDKESLQKIEEIVAINVGWKAELFDRYPRLSGKGRPLRTSEDSTGETSFLGIPPPSVAEKQPLMEKGMTTAPLSGTLFLTGTRRCRHWRSKSRLTPPAGNPRS